MKYPDIPIRNTFNDLALIRQVKTDEEIAFHRRACDVTAEGVKCMVCGKERIPLKEHAYKTEAGHEHECADCGYAYTSDLVFTAINDGKEWQVSEPDGNAFWSVKELVVPAYKEGKPVTELAEGSFNNDYSLQAVRLPYTLKKLFTVSSFRPVSFPRARNSPLSPYTRHSPATPGSWGRMTVMPFRTFFSSSAFKMTMGRPAK